MYVLRLSLLHFERVKGCVKHVQLKIQNSQLRQKVKFTFHE